MTWRFTAMGCEVVVAGGSPASRAEIGRLFAEREQTFSRFRDDSELGRVNAASGMLVPVSREFARALRTAIDAAEETDGLVDPTVGAAMRASGYTASLERLAVDGPLGVPVPAGRWREVRLAGDLVATPPGVLLDLAGVVKAQAVDDALELLEGDGFVSAGGDLATRGGIDVAVPGDEVIRLVAGGLATSGIGRRHWLRGGELQHHLIDPATGRPSTSPWRSVTVAGASCRIADTAAKAAFLAGEDGPAWLEARALPGRFLDRDGAVLVNAPWAGALEASCT